MNGAPIPGDFIVVPSVGVERQTRFNVTIVPFIDLGGNYPLVYTFFYENRHTSLPVCHFSPSSSLLLFLCLRSSDFSFSLSLSLSPPKYSFFPKKCSHLRGS